MKRKTIAKPAAKPRRNKDKERLELAQHHLQHAAGERDRHKAELDRVQDASLKVYRMLEAEHAELLARALKVKATMKTLECRIWNEGSPPMSRIDGCTFSFNGAKEQY